MNQKEFESRVLHLWVTSRVPLTRANLLFYTQAPRRRLDGWLDELVRDGVLDIDSDDAGEMIWLVRGAERPAQGSERIDEVVKIEQLGREVRSLVPRAARDVLDVRVHHTRDKSLVLSGAASFFLGPIGWLYAAPMREALPAIVIFFMVSSLLRYIPFVGGVLTAPLMVLSAVLGVLYASRFNQTGERTPLLLDGDHPSALPPRKSRP